MKYVIGIDLGTSGVKCILLSENGNIIDSTSVKYKPDFIENGFVEQEPYIWWKKTKEALSILINKNSHLKENIDAISCSGQMHSSVFLDSNGNSIRKAILWNDTRTTKQVKEICDLCINIDNIISKVYNIPLEGFTLPKILWLKENENDNFKKLSKVIMPKDYINYMLTGNIYTDISDASGTLMFDVKNLCWSNEILELVKLDASILPEVLESTDLVGTIKNEIANDLGISSRIKIIAGGADNSCAAVGNGITSKGKAVISIGTSGTVIAYLDNIPSNLKGNVHLFNYSIPNSFYAMGCMLCAGESLNWLKRNIFENISFNELNNLARNIPAGSNGVIFLPYLFGERNPYNDSNARGVFFGLSGSTGKGEIIRSVMEGVGFGIKDLLNIVLDFTDINEIYITGGGAKSDIWGQIISDIIQYRINILNIEEGPSFGAGLIALVGSEIQKDFNFTKEDTIKIIKTITPGNNTEKYSKIYKIYNELYKSNKHIFEQLKSI